MPPTTATRAEFADAETLAAKVALFATRSAADPAAWHRFGFGSCPPASNLLLHLMSRERLDGDRFLLRELAVASIVLSVRALRTDLGEAGRRLLAARAAELAALRVGIAPWLRCESPAACALVLAAGVGTYFGAHHGRQPELFYARARAAAPRAVNRRWRDGGTDVFTSPDCVTVRAAAYLQRTVPDALVGTPRLGNAEVLQELVRHMD